jgi:hypothetical protein
MNRRARGTIKNSQRHVVVFFAYNLLVMKHVYAMHMIKTMQ